MRVADLLQRLDGHCGGRVLAGMHTAEALEAVRAGRHPRPVMGEALAMILNWTLAGDGEHQLSRAAAIEALGPLRRRLMAEDAPPEALREVQSLVEAIDAAFDDEALDA